MVQLDVYERCPIANGDDSVTITNTETTYGYLCKAKDAYGDSLLSR